MKILFQVPHLNMIYAGRTICYGYKHAFEDLGHEFRFLTADHNTKKVFIEFQPNIFMTNLHSYNLKYIDLEVIKQQKKRRVRIFVNTPFWKSPLPKLRINEPPSLSKNKKYINLIKSGDFGDVYYNVCEQGDARMDGFQKMTGYKHYTIPLAADKTIHFPEYSENFRADISYIGTYLPEKSKFIKEFVFPLKKKHSLRLYGQDWTFKDRMLGLMQKVGQYFDIALLRSLQKPKLQLEDERRIYTSSIISINIHENHQKMFKGDCNERTFKIPICGGFEITDDVGCIRRYFKDGEEIIIAKNRKDWFEKIDYYMKNPEKRLPIIEAGRKRVLQNHTYHNRVKQILQIYSSFKKHAGS